MTALELHPPAAPARRVPLADIIASGPEDQEPAPGFVANLHGEDVEVTAVLERTAVIAPLYDRWAEKQTARLGRPARGPRGGQVEAEDALKRLP